MSFGKRTRTRPVYDPSRHEDDVASEHTSYQEMDAEAPSSGLAGKLVVSVLIFVAFGVGASLLMQSGLKAALTGQANGGGLTYQDLPGSHLEQSAMTRRMVRLCLPPLDEKTRQKLRPGHTGFTNRLSRAGRSRDDGMANYLICAMRTERLRLYRPEHRAALVKELRVYFHTLDQRRKLNERMPGHDAPMSGVANTTLELTRRLAQSTTGKRASLKPMAPRRDVVRGMRYLMSLGYLEVGDFGWFTPAELKPYFNNLPEREKACG